MDVLTLAFYATICGALSALSPRLRTPARRLVVGAAVGVLAAAALPHIRAVLGG